MAIKEAPPAEAGAKDGKDAGGKKSKKKLIIIAVVVLALVGGVYFMFLKPKPKTAPKPPEAGVVVKLDAININLQGEHYLKLGIALQATKTAKEPPEGSAALDSAITLFTGKSVKELSVPSQVQKLKTELLEVVKKDYDDDVMDIYFTQFVMQ